MKTTKLKTKLRLKKKIENEVEELAGDPGFVFFLPYYTGLVGLNRDRDHESIKTLFQLNPIPTNPPHRPVNIPFLLTTHYLSDYFSRLEASDRRCHWSLTEKVLRFFGKLGKSSIKREWHYRKKKFEELTPYGAPMYYNPSTLLVLYFYERNKDRIKHIIALYEKERKIISLRDIVKGIPANQASLRYDLRTKDEVFTIPSPCEAQDAPEELETLHADHERRRHLILNSSEVLSFWDPDYPFEQPTSIKDGDQHQP